MKAFRDLLQDTNTFGKDCMWDNMKININRLINKGGPGPYYFEFPNNIYITLSELDQMSSYYTLGMLYETDEKGKNNFYLSCDSKWVEEYTIGNTFLFAYAVKCTFPHTTS